MVESFSQIGETAEIENSDIKRFNLIILSHPVKFNKVS